MFKWPFHRIVILIDDNFILCFTSQIVLLNKCWQNHLISESVFFFLSRFIWNEKWIISLSKWNDDVCQMNAKQFLANKITNFVRKFLFQMTTSSKKMHKNEKKRKYFICLSLHWFNNELLSSDKKKKMSTRLFGNVN